MVPGLGLGVLWADPWGVQLEGRYLACCGALGALVEAGDGGVEGIEAAFEIVEPGQDPVMLLFEFVAEGEVAGGDAVVDFVEAVVELGAGDVLGFGLWTGEEFFGDEDKAGDEGRRRRPKLGGERAESGDLAEDAHRVN